jgi:hypothetical protein
LNSDSFAEKRDSGAGRFVWPIYVALVATTWLVNYPGRINPDSLAMLWQAQHIGELNDWHAPSVTWLWSLFTPLLGQPAGALLVQSLLMFVYPAIAQRHARRMSFVSAAISVAWVIFFVALIAVTGQVVKDVVLVGLILCLLAVLDLRLASTPMWLSLGGLLALIMLVRPTNFVMLALAGVIWAIFVFQRCRRRLMAVVLILAGSAATFPVSQFVNRVLLTAGDAMAERQLIIFDIAGVSSDIKQDLFVELPNWPRDEVLRPWECYTPKTWEPFAFGACSRYAELVGTSILKEGKTSVVRWWLEVILRHPFSYLKQRFLYSYELIRHMSPITSWGPPYATNDQTRNELNGPFTNNIDMTHSFQLWKMNIAYAPFGRVAAVVVSHRTVALAILICIATLLLAWRDQRTKKGFDMVVVVSSALGAGNFVMLMLFGIATDGRYLLVTFVCGVISLLRMLNVSIVRKDELTLDLETERLCGGHG